MISCLLMKESLPETLATYAIPKSRAMMVKALYVCLATPTISYPLKLQRALERKHHHNQITNKKGVDFKARPLMWCHFVKLAKTGTSF